MYEIIVSEKANRQIKKLPLLIKDRIYHSLQRIKIRPHHFLKSLSGSNYFRLRVGDYRLILDIKNDKLVVIVLEVGHRKKIYKK